ncbi:glycosyltransferase 61 family protein [Salipiger abyssi]|uniref:glycosyltransferase 61 family protein n=1 Tax=Salipiger abyssi TaxID=1250539 RepID=UPI004058881E
MHKFHVAPQKEVTEYRNVIIDHLTGIIVDDTGQLVVEQADEALLWIPEAIFRAVNAGADKEFEFRTRRMWLQRLARRLHEERDRLEVLHEDVTHISMMHAFGWYAFGHFFDSVQKLYHPLKLMETGARRWKVLHSDPRQVVDFEQHMQLLGVAPEQLVRVSHPVRVPRLWVSPWQAGPATFTPQTYDWVYRRYTRSVERTAPQRLYLTRNHVKRGARGVTNEAALLAALEPLGFRVLTGKEPLREIVSAFHNAELIVAPHGSLLANCMFCKETCRVLEFCPDNRVDFSFQRKRKKLTDYTHKQVPADANFNIEIPLQTVLDFIDGTSRRCPDAEKE